MIDQLTSGLAQAAFDEQRGTPEKSEHGFEEVFARLLVQEVKKAMPEGSGMGGGMMDMLSPILDEALVSALVDAGVSPQKGATTTMPARKTQIHGLVDGGRVSSRFGKRIDPLTHAHRNHDGVDIAAARGSSIRAARPGQVTFAGRRGGYGNLVIIDHGHGMESRYAHCDRILVREGDTIQGDAAIATVGSTGRSTGPHLHFEVRKDGSAVDPTSWMRSQK
jgi:murein DD-endopeptidase MepM/ murein hydrolase activator NlpD